MAPSEGSREIEAAQKRLAAAKARAAADAEALESAKEAEKSAKEMAQLAKKSAVMAEANATSAAKSTAEADSRLKNSAEESKEAAKFLKEAEERWNIYTVDDSDDDEAEEESRKKQKTSDAEEENVAQEAPAPSRALCSVDGCPTGLSAVREWKCVPCYLAECNGRGKGDKQGGGDGRRSKAGKKKNAAKSKPAPEVIGIDEDPEEGSSHKKQKAAAGFKFKPLSRRSIDIEEDAEMKEIVVEGCGDAAAKHSNKKQRTADETTRVEEDEVEEVVVEGCGNAKANGTYNRNGTSDWGSPKYVKMSELDGQVRRFLIFFTDPSVRPGPAGRSTSGGGKPHWIISVGPLGGTMSLALYFRTCSARDTLPPKTGWEVCHDGTAPAPELKWGGDILEGLISQDL